MGCPGGTSSVFTDERLSGKKRTLLYISREKGPHFYFQTRHNDLFFPITIFFKENLKKKWPEKRA